MISFDKQASSYEARAGLPDTIARAIAVEITRDAAPQACVVDVGAGTGIIGRHLVATGVRYVALEASAPMLDELARALPSATNAELFAVDADRPWPLPERAASRVLFSRSLHQLDVAHGLAQVLRVGAPGCRVLVGRVRKSDDSPAEILRRHLQRLLREVAPNRHGDRVERQFLETLEARGARPLPVWQSESWTEHASPRQSIEHWREKIGRRDLQPATQAEILAELTAWAETRFGDLSTLHPLTRRYELTGVELA